jgi:UDP-2,3-diacylglucosamine pyrophosphatase LpxH
MLDAIIISDLHLGSNVCQAASLIKFLESLDDTLLTKQLFINGDIFNSWNLARLTKLHWKVLGRIRSLSDHIEIHWINGNHDGPAEIVSHLLGVDVEKERILISGNKKILLLHGDVFDKFITDHPILTWIGDTIYSFLQKIDPSFFIAKKAKLGSKTFLRCSELIRTKAVEYAKKKHCDVVCCGHTHLAVAEVNEISYYNSGCWTEPPCTYLTVKDGQIELKHFE